MNVRSTLVFTGFNIDGNGSYVTWFPRNAGVSYEMNNVSLVLLTLYSQPYSNNQGFQISYESGFPDNSQNVSSNSNVYANQYLGHIHYPAEPTDSVNLRDLSTFMFAPIGNVNNKSRTIEVTYSRIGMRQDCSVNELRVYYLDSSVSYYEDNMWKLMGKICGSTTTTLQHNDMILVVFHNFYNESPEFEFTYTNRLT